MDLTITFFGLLLITGIDGLYLKLNSDFYKPIMGSEQINIIYALLAWLTIIISIQLIILSRPDINESNVFIAGVILGFATYGLYNFTSASIYPDKWTNSIIIGDTAWGMLLTGGITYSLYKIKNAMIV